MKVIDTCILIDHFRGHQPATRYIESLDDNEVILSVITEAEALSGESCNTESVRERILHLLARWKHIEVSHDIALRAGDIKRAHGLALPDALIAATALSNKAELLTRNTGDFKKVEGLTVLAPY